MPINKYMYRLQPLLGFWISFCLSFLAYAGSPTSTTFQTQITTPNGAALEAPSVNFRFTILDSAGTCVLYVEDYANINMTGSKGVIAFPLGTGSKQFPPAAIGLHDIFNNSTPSYNCQAGGTISPSATDNRQIIMQFNDGNGWQTLPQMAINAVPYANYATRAESLGAYLATDYLRPATLPTCSAGQSLRWDGTVFTCIAAGASGGTMSGVTSIANASGDITLAPATATGAVVINSGTASVGSSTGAVVVSGGVGVSGAVNAAGSINSSSNITSVGYVGIGTTTPQKILDVNGLRTGTGVVSVGAGSTTITGTGTAFTSQISVGDSIQLSGDSRTVISIASNTSLTVDMPYASPVTNTAFTIRKAYAFNAGTGIFGETSATRTNSSSIFGNVVPVYEFVSPSTQAWADFTDLMVFRHKNTGTYNVLQSQKMAFLLKMGNEAMSNDAYGGGGLLFETNSAYMAAPTLSLINGNARRLSILSNGYVGIGTTSPSYALSVSGDVNVSGNFRVNGTVFTAGGANQTGVSSISNASGDITLAPAVGTGAVQINSGSASTSPTTGALVVSGGIGVSGGIYTGGAISSGSTISATTSMYSPQLFGTSTASGNIYIDGTSNLTKGAVFLASAGGSVGVGTTSTLERLNINTSAGLKGLGIYYNASGNPNVRGGMVNAGVTGNNSEYINGLGGFQIAAQGSACSTSGCGNIHFLTPLANSGSFTTDATLSPRMSILYNGNVGVGTTSPAYALDVQGTMNSPYDPIGYPVGPTVSVSNLYGGNNQNAVLMFNPDLTTNPYAWIGATGKGGNTSAMYFGGRYGSSFREAMRIDMTNGNVGIGTTTPNAKLEIAGAAITTPNIITSGAAVDLSLSNIHYLKSVGGSTIALTNPKSGGSYTLVVSDTAQRTYTFTGCTNSYFSPTNGQTYQRTTYSILVIVDGANTDCYINWMTGYE